MASCGFRLLGRIMITLTGLTKRFGEKTAVDGLTVEITRGRGHRLLTWSDQPYSPLIGLLTLTGWAAAALLAGAAALKTRDT